MAISLDGVTHYVINSAGVKSMKQKLFQQTQFHLYYYITGIFFLDLI